MVTLSVSSSEILEFSPIVCQVSSNLSIIPVEVSNECPYRKPIYLVLTLLRVAPSKFVIWHWLFCRMRPINR